MGLLNRLFARKSAPMTSAELARIIIDGPVARSGVSVSETTALQVAAALCAGRVLAEGVAQLPLKVYRESGAGNRVIKEAARDHWAWNLLRRQPNDWMTSFEFREALTLHAVFTGNGYAIVNRGAATGRVVEVLPVLPNMVRVEQDADYGLTYTVRDRHGVIGRFQREQMLHLRGPSWDAVTGLNVVHLAREAIGLSVSLQATQADLQAKGGRPPGILSNETPLSDEARKRLKAAWDARYGPNGEGGVAVLDGAWKFISLAMTGVDAQHIENRRFQIEEIARAFRVFPQMLMQADKTSTYASAEQFFLAHVIHSLDPWLVRWEGVFLRDVLRGADDIIAEFARTGLLRGASKDRGEYFAKALGAGGSPAWMTPNEVRALENLNPVDGGDELPRPINMTTEQAHETEDADTPA